MLLCRCGVAEAYGTSDVGGAFQILSTCVDEQQSLWGEGVSRFVGRLVVHNGTMILIAGNHVETVATIRCVSGTLLLKTAVNIHFRDAVSHILLQPHHHAHHGRAIVEHGLTEARYLTLVLHAFKRNHWRCHIGFVANHRLTESVAHTVRVNHHRGCAADFAEEFLNIIVILDFHAVFLQVVLHFRGHLFRVDKQHSLIFAHIRKRDNHRSVVHIAATQVQQPSDLVEGGDEQSVGIGSVEGINHARNLAIHIFTSQCLIVYESWIHRACRAVGPNGLGGTEIGGKHKAILSAEHFNAVRLNQRK